MKYVLITGATSGIGLAVAKKLLDDGAHVLINYAHDDARAAWVKAELSEFEGRFTLLKADVSCLEGITALAEKTMERFPRIDYLVLNACATDKTDFAQVSPENWNHVMDINVSMPFFLMQKLFEHMSPGGSVICTGAVMGIFPHAISISYSVSKAALHMLCQSMVKVYAQKGITINALCPGFVETPMQEGKTPEHRARIENKIALKRFAAPGEVADMCVAVLKNGYINGAVIPVCGGYCME